MCVQYWRDESHPLYWNRLKMDIYYGHDKKEEREKQKTFAVESATADNGIIF